jgi:N-acyl-D-aspartate/D-glutamate deacylase
MDLMEGVEESPNPVLAAGLTWEWESFPDFMDALERRQRAMMWPRSDLTELRLYHSDAER